MHLIALSRLCALSEVSFLRFSALTFFLQLIYPTVIAPLFNKFTPLEDGNVSNMLALLSLEVLTCVSLRRPYLFV